jgi:esterase/lipase superfamily enzyme
MTDKYEQFADDQHKTNVDRLRLNDAAPELLAILQAADKRIILEAHGFDQTFSDRVETAIAKATGQ